MPRNRAAPQPCRALCPRRAEDDRFLYEGSRLRGQRRRRGRPHHLPVAQPERPPSGRAGARPHHRCRDRRWCSRCRSTSARSPTCRRAFRKVRDAGCEGIRPICHGNAWSVYFQDPEGNQIEMFCDTPWYVPQPLRLQDRPRQAARTSSTARPKPIAATATGFKPIEEWRAEISKKIAAQPRRAKRTRSRREIRDERKQRLSRPRLLQRRDQAEGGGAARDAARQVQGRSPAVSATSRAGRTRSRSST